MTYEELLIKYTNDDLEVHELDMVNNGLYADGIIAIDKKQSSTEKKCILAEEIGHYYTSVGDILNQDNIQNIKQEQRARGWAYYRVLDPTALILAYKFGCKSRHEIAEYLDVTEDFLQDAIAYFKKKYGLYYKIDAFVIQFEPLGILELFDQH